MNSARQAGHKGTPASRSSKRSKAKCTERVRTWATSLYPWGMTGWRYASIKGRTDKSRSTTALCSTCGRTDRFCTALATRARLQGERSTASTAGWRRTSRFGFPLRAAKHRPAAGRMKRATQGPPRCALSDEPTLRKTHDRRRSDHQVIEYPHVHQRQRGLERLRQHFVSTAGLRRTRRMVVRQDHSGSIELQ